MSADSRDPARSGRAARLETGAVVGLPRGLRLARESREREATLSLATRGARFLAVELVRRSGLMSGDAALLRQLPHQGWIHHRKAAAALWGTTRDRRCRIDDDRFRRRRWGFGGIFVTHGCLLPRRAAARRVIRSGPV